SKQGEATVNLEKQYGKIVRYHIILNKPYLLIFDQKLVQQILINRSYDFPKFFLNKNLTRDLVGDGISSVKGDVHKRQRKMMSPSFSFANVKEMLPILVHAAYNLRDIWIKQIGNKNEEIVTITDIISNITLDIIGIAGFNYEFNSTTTDSELARAYRSALVFNPLLVFISDIFPVIGKIPYFNRNKDSVKTIHNISEQLVNEQKNSTVRGKNFLSLLIQANEKLPDDEKLTHHELVSQVMTLLLAGHETT
ncbi:14683_t:CDS:2, partial [Racocetra persica]